MDTVLSENLKKLRQQKNLTQEQAAEFLNVTAHTVSRWECGTTLPDVMLLPQIAGLYCVTIDDLFRKAPVVYESYAQRLASVYEATHRPEDFISADFEFRKLIKSGNSSAEDLRTYGILHQHMMCYCIDKATGLFDKVIGMGKDVNRDVFWKTKRQKMALFSQIGKARENIDSALAVMDNGSDDPEDWICLIAAYSYVGEAEKAYKWFLKAINRFPDNAILYVYGGDACQNLGKYDEAFRYWGKALELDGKMYDARYSMGFCYERLGEYGRAYDIWIETARNLGEDGYEVEKQFPLELAEKCREILEKDPQHFSQDTVIPAE